MFGGKPAESFPQMKLRMQLLALNDSAEKVR